VLEGEAVAQTPIWKCDVEQHRVLDVRLGAGRKRTSERSPQHLSFADLEFADGGTELVAQSAALGIGEAHGAISRRVNAGESRRHLETEGDRCARRRPTA
jgi:hypothetical protein